MRVGVPFSSSFLILGENVIYIWEDFLKLNLMDPNVILLLCLLHPFPALCVHQGECPSYTFSLSFSVASSPENILKKLFSWSTHSRHCSLLLQSYLIGKKSHYVSTWFISFSLMNPFLLYFSFALSLSVIFSTAHIFFPFLFHFLVSLLIFFTFISFVPLNLVTFQSVIR